MSYSTLGARDRTWPASESPQTLPSHHLHRPPARFLLLTLDFIFPGFEFHAQNIDSCWMHCVASVIPYYVGDSGHVIVCNNTIFE